MGQKFARNRSIAYHLKDIFNVLFSTIIQDGRQKWRKLKFFPLCIGYSCTTLRVKNSLEIALSRTVFEIFTLFHFPLKSKIEIFSPSHRILLYYPVGQKFARNRFISYDFRDIHTFSFSAKIQDGRQKWRQLKFFPVA